MENYCKGWGNLSLPKNYIDIVKNHNLKLTIGNLRSYGDVCELAGGKIDSSLSKNRFISFDEKATTVEVEAGMTIGELCKWSISKKLFPNTVPGTQFATIGGCIANDVHGKNHHQQGSFGNGVIEIKLLREDKEIICSKEKNSELFNASIGGLGLTGKIKSAKLQLLKITSPYLSIRAIKFSNLDEYYAIDREIGNNYPYTVAWLDCAKTYISNNANYRGIYIAGEPIEISKSEWLKYLNQKKAKNITFPLLLPFSLVNKYSLKIFNFFYYHKKLPSSTKLTSLQSFFFPLDHILLWNRIYGKKGFYQYQNLLPAKNKKDSLIETLSIISNSGFGSPLLVLKNFGKIPSVGLMSFPGEGVTLALDFVNHGNKTLELLNKLDQVTIEAGGRVNPAKDTRMNPQTFSRYFPQYEKMESFREPGRCSDFWLRVNSGKYF